MNKMIMNKLTEVDQLFREHPQFVEESYRDYYFRYNAEDLISLSIWGSLKTAGDFPIKYNDPNEGRILCELPIWYRVLFEKANRILYGEPEQNKLRTTFHENRRRPQRNILYSICGIYGKKAYLRDINDPIEEGKGKEYWFKEIRNESFLTFLNECEKLLKGYNYETKIRHYEDYTILYVE